MEDFNETKAQKELEKGYSKAKDLLKNEDKMEAFLRKLEKKLEVIPVAGNKLSMIPVMISLIKAYVKKEYKSIPLGSIIAVISALIYWLAPVDAIPDAIPGVGYVDDALVITACLKLVGSDVDDYKKWRDEKERDIV